METEDEDDTNDEDFNVEIRQFSSCSHRFSKVSEIWHKHRGSLLENFLRVRLLLLLNC